MTNTDRLQDCEDNRSSGNITQIRSQITNTTQSITIFHVIGFIFGVGMAIPPTTSIETALWYLLFVMLLLYLAAMGSGFKKRSVMLEFVSGMWGALGTVYIVAIWYYFSQQFILSLSLYN